MEKDLFDIDKQEADSIKPNNCININIGILGHVDSGKTSICRILSQIISTASLDKNPQSQERGITLDLGFSAFLTRVPYRLEADLKEQYLQFTLVDCPGHASLIKTVIGGAQIIDIMFLVIDINKGIQTQTAECIIIAQLFIKKLIVVINKVDLIPDPKVLEAKKVALRKIFGKTKFGQNVTMVLFSTKEKPYQYSKSLKEILLDQIIIPERNIQGNFLLLIDHCFKIKGKGTIITGTILQGKVKPNDQIQICQIKQKSKVKSIQMFRKTLTVGKQGDRVALLMTQIQAQQIERGIACTPGSMKKIIKCVIDVNRIRLYKKPIKNKAKFHIISGHQTVMGELRLFISKHKELDLQEEFLGINQLDQIQQKLEKQQQKYPFAVVTFQKQLYGIQRQKLIGYKFDLDNDQKSCRISFYGVIQIIINENNPLKIYKQKTKKGIIDRIVDNYTIIVKDLFDKQFNIQTFIGKQIILDATGQVGKIQGSFGKSGKIRVIFKEVLKDGSIQGTQVSLKYNKWYQ